MTSPFVGIIYHTGVSVKRDGRHSHRGGVVEGYRLAIVVIDCGRDMVHEMRSHGSDGLNHMQRCANVVDTLQRKRRGTRNSVIQEE